MSKEMYADFNTLINELIEGNEQELATSEGVFVGRNGEMLLAVNNGSQHSQNWSVSAIAKQEAEDVLRASLQPTEISVYLGDNNEFSVMFTGDSVAINTKMSLADLEYALSVAAAKYSIALLEQLNVEVNESNCNKAANYFDFNIFEEGMLEYELELYNK